MSDEHTADQTDDHPENEKPRKKRKQPPASERSMQAKLASNISWARTPRSVERQARTLPARTAFDARFEREVDPDGVLTVAERRVAAAAARKAYFARLALKSAQKRRTRS